MRHLPAPALATLFALFCSPLFTSATVAQGYGPQLAMQGINHTSIPSARSRAAGGISMGIAADPALMFVHPAALQGLTGFHISVGALHRDRTLEQQQQWMPLRNFPTFSLMMEGLLDNIPDPDLSEPPPEGLGPEDSLARPYDSIMPNWSRSERTTVPLQAVVALPLDFLGASVVAGAGVVEYANLDHYFQNNNVLSPSIGSQRPVGIPLPAIGQEVAVAWSQQSQRREGSIMGYGGAVSVAVSEDLSLGVSGLVLDGRTDDVEMSALRGRIRFGNNNNVFFYRVDSVYAKTTRTGTSDYSGTEFNLSARYRSSSFLLSLMVKPPSTLSRDYRAIVQQDSSGGSTTASVSYRDEISLPWRGTVGIALFVREDLLLGLEYDFRPFSSAEYRNSSGVTSRPWLSGSQFRVGVEFQPAPWLSLRGGLREQTEVFEQEGNALPGEPVRSSVYSAGVGITVGGFTLDAAYEYSLLKYEDLWQTNVNINSETRHGIVTSLSFALR